MIAVFKSPLSPLLQRGGPLDGGLLVDAPLCKRGAGGDFASAEIPKASG